MEVPRIDPAPHPAPKVGAARVLPNRVPVVGGCAVDPKSDPAGFCGCCGCAGCPNNEVVGCAVLVEGCGVGCPKSVGGEMVFVPMVVPAAGAPKILEGALFPNSGFEAEVKGPAPCTGAVVVAPPKRLAVGCVVAFPKSPPVEGCGCCCALVLVPNRPPPDCWGCVVAAPNNELPAGCCCDCCVFVPPNRFPPAG